MDAWVEVWRQSRGPERLLRARWCSSYACRLKGLMFRRRLADDEGLLLVDSGESRMSATIHMWFVFMTLGVAWLDKDQRVVDLQLARPWHIYAPHAAARYILEGPPSMIEELAIGDELSFEASSPS